jgi:hypothetical protein
MRTVAAARSSAYDPTMPIKLWSDASKTFEDVSDDGLAEDIRAMREFWRQAAPEQRVQLKALAERR